MTTIDFDLGGLDVSISHKLLTNPTFDTAPTETSKAANANIRLIWNKDLSGNWDKLFTYKTDADTFDNTAATDIDYTSSSTEWYTGNLMTEVGVSAANAANTGLTQGARATQTPADMSVLENIISKDLLAHIAYEIFGQNLGLDMFSNEAAMLTDLQRTTANSCMANIETKINTLVAASNTAGLIGTKDSTNFAHHLLTNILEPQGTNSDDFTRRTAAVDAYNTNGGPGKTHKVPLIAGDTISFSITIQPTFTASDTNGSLHGIGTQTVRSRIYKVTLVLASD